MLLPIELPNLVMFTIQTDHIRFIDIRPVEEQPSKYCICVQYDDDTRTIIFVSDPTELAIKFQEQIEEVYRVMIEAIQRSQIHIPPYIPPYIPINSPISLFKE